MPFFRRFSHFSARSEPQGWKGAKALLKKFLRPPENVIPDLKGNPGTSYLAYTMDSRFRENDKITPVSGIFGQPFKGEGFTNSSVCFHGESRLLAAIEAILHHIQVSLRKSFG